MDIPTFSLFSAVSEVFVTIGVLYGMITTMRGKKFPKAMMGAVLIFEGCVNVVYMANMASKTDKAPDLSTVLKAFGMVHGVLSLLMFLAIAGAYLLALRDDSNGYDNWFRRNRAASYVLIFFWMVSVLSGEAFFFMRYIAGPMLG